MGCSDDSDQNKQNQNNNNPAQFGRTTHVGSDTPQGWGMATATWGANNVGQTDF